jgi:hypothetical protein
MPSKWVAAVFLASSLATGAAALDTFGPPFGATKYSTAIRSSGGIPDEDDYAGSLLAGEKLSVSVVAGKGSTLLPALSLIDPDGNETSPPVVEKAGGKSVSLAAFAVPKTGRWGVRVEGKNATEGTYTIAFSVKPAPKAPVVKRHLGGADPLVSDFSFDALDGALLDVSVKWPKKQAVVHIGTLHDPAGALAATPPAKQKPGAASFTHAVLHKGDGAYVLQVYVDSGEADCSVSLKVTPQGRPKSKAVLLLLNSEPALTPRDTPIEGARGGRVHITGSGFPVSGPLPAVYFGRLPSPDVTVASDGNSLDATAPDGPDGATVSVAVVAADGQGAARDAYFHFVPAPVITEL